MSETGEKSMTYTMRGVIEGTDITYTVKGPVERGDKKVTKLTETEIRERDLEILASFLP
ncbi:MAG: hypothetical protein WAV41_02280 [Microgenomates group bacterium]